MRQKNKAESLISHLCSKITTAAEFRTMVVMLLSRNIKSKYTWQDPASQAYLEDAGVDQDQAHQILLDLFYTKFTTQFVDDKKQKTEQEIWHAIYQQVLSMTAAGDYKDTAEGATELAESAMSYRCYEPWNYITAHTGQLLQTLSPGLVADWNKAVNYLYDGYAVCEETA
jgi:hypothetical protein